MFTNILWATDGSDHADSALDYAARLAAAEHAQLHVVHIVEKIVGGRVAGQNLFVNEDEIDSKIKEQARQASSAHGIKTTIHLAPSGFGNIADRIAEIAVDTGADLIVVGTHGRSALGGLVLGSVTQHLLHLAVCPVLAIPRPRVADGATSSQPEASTVT